MNPIDFFAKKAASAARARANVRNGLRRTRAVFHANGRRWEHLRVCISYYYNK